MMQIGHLEYTTRKGLCLSIAYWCKLSKRDVVMTNCSCIGAYRQTFWKQVRHIAWWTVCNVRTQKTWAFCKWRRMPWPVVKIPRTGTNGPEAEAEVVDAAVGHFHSCSEGWIICRQSKIIQLPCTFLQSIVNIKSYSQYSWHSFPQGEIQTKHCYLPTAIQEWPWAIEMQHPILLFCMVVLISVYGTRLAA